MIGVWESEKAYALRQRREAAAFKRGCVRCGSRLAWLMLFGGPKARAVCMNPVQCRRRAGLTKGPAK